MKKTIFKNKNFMILWAGRLVSQLGNSIHSFAIAWYIYDITGSTLALSASFISSFLPRALISMFAGVVADKYDRKRIIVICDVISGILVITMFMISSFYDLTLILILVLNTLLSIVSAFFGPASSAAIQSILSEDEYQDGNVLNQLLYRFSDILGAALGGILLKTIGIKYLLLFNGVSFLLSALSETFIKLPRVKEETKKESMGQSIRIVISFLKENKILLFMSLFAGIIANGMLMSGSLYLPGVFKDVLGKTSSELGLFYSIIGIVATVTSLFLLALKSKLNPYRWILITLTLEGIYLMGLGLASNFASMIVLAVIGGFSFAMCSIMCGVLYQMLTPNEIMGRFSSFGGLLGSVSIPIFTIVFGMLGEVYTLQNIIVVSGIIFLIALLPAPFIFAREKKDINIEESINEAAVSN